MQIDPELQQRFEACVDACAESLYRVAYRLTGNQTLAGELVQETYLNAWKSISNLSDPEKMRGWMFAILRNQYTKLLRKETKAAATSEYMEQLAFETVPKEKDDSADRVQSAIASLDDKHRLPVLLVSMEGLSVEEAAKALDVPRGTVLSRLHRGRQKLKEILGRDQSQAVSKEGKE